MASAQADCTIDPVPLGHIGSSTCQDPNISIPAPGIIGTVNQSAIVLRDSPANPGADMNVWHNSGFATVWGDTTGKAGYDVKTANNLNYQTITPFNINTYDTGNHLSFGMLLEAGKNIFARITSLITHDNAVGIQAVSHDGSIDMAFDYVGLSGHAAGIKLQTNGHDLSLATAKDTSWITVGDNGVGIEARDVGSSQNRRLYIDSTIDIRNAATGILAASNAADIFIENRNSIHAKVTGIHAQTGVGQIGINNYHNVSGLAGAAILAQGYGAKPVYIGSHAGLLTGMTGIDASNRAGDVVIENNSIIHSAANGIMAQSVAGTVAVLNKNRIHAEGGAAIDVQGDGAIYIENAADLSSNGFAAIHAQNGSGKDTLTIRSLGGALTGPYGIATHASSGHTTIDNQSAINASQTGISAQNDSGDLTIASRNVINAGWSGIDVRAGHLHPSRSGSLADASASSSEPKSMTRVDVLADITAKAYEQSTALRVESTGDGIIHIGPGAKLDSARGIELNATADSVFTLSNFGTIDTLTDRAISGTGVGSVVFDNAGSLYGNVDLQDTQTSFLHNGLWTLRNLTGSQAFDIRDTQGVAISRFGADSLFQNHGLITLDHSATSLWNADGAYMPAGSLAPGNSASHAQLLGLSVFEHHGNGVIDLAGNAKAGDVLVISGSQEAGQNGGGSFITHGGSIKLDTVLNAGGDESLSDMLVVDNVQFGTAVTNVFIHPILSRETSTVDDGIKIIDVLGSSHRDAFRLGAPLTYGIYEYFLAQGANSDSWFLRNHYGGNETSGNETGGNESGSNETGDNETGGNETGGNESGGNETGGNETGGNETGGNETGGNESGGNETGGNETGGNETGGNETGGNETGGNETGGNEIGGNETGGNENGGDGGAQVKEYLLNPNIGSYSGNQFAASEMFYHSKSDRQNELYGHDRTLWLRTRYNHVKTDLLAGRQSLDVSTSVFQLGANLLQTDSWMAGVYGGLGNSSVHNRSNQTGTTASGRVKGHHVGGYATWQPDERLGPYFDFWAHYAWFNNRLGGAEQASEVQYGGRGVALSAEGGHSFIVGNYSSGSVLLMQPHAQFSFSRMKMDDFTDSHNTRYTDGVSSGMKARMGIKLAKSLPDNHLGLAPYTELNWLVNDINHDVKMNGKGMTTEMGRHVAEVKLGVQGKASSNLNLWGHVGVQRGSEHFQNTQLQLGGSWQF
jgi:outer membrane autotransporter protein